MTASRSVRICLLSALTALAVALPFGAAAPAAHAGALPAAPASVSPAAAAVEVHFERVANGLNQPVLVTSANDGSSRMFVVERAGRIRVFNSDGLRSSAYLDIRSRVNSSGGEQGLLGLAFSPTFATDRWLWVAYTDSSGGLLVSRFRASSARAGTVSASTEEKLFKVQHPTYTNHNAGMLVFSPEKLLYISTGDGGGSGDPFNNAQDLRSRNGKIMRIDPFHGCDGQKYCIPSTNPYASPGGGLGMIWHYGLRNPWRFSVDRSTGDLWIADVGQNRYEEVTHVPATAKAWDLGWSCREARSVYNSSRCSSSRTYHDPTTAYSHTYGAAVIGGYVYRGSKYASLMAGRYLFGDFISGHVWLYGSGSRDRVGEFGANRLSAFGEGDAGELWATTLDGGLFKVRPRAA